MFKESILNKRNIFTVTAVAIVLLMCITVLSYINSQQTLVVKYKNISHVTLVETKNSKTLGKKVVVKKSGENITLTKGEYLLNYTGETGYESNSQVVYLQNKPVSISLDPDYSEARLIDMLDQDFDNIKSVLNEKYQNMSDYNIEKGKLYKKGKWYATTLQYVGNDYFNYDSLRLVMKKEGGDTWKLVTNPPSIVISSHEYPNIPIDILKDINNVQNSPFTEKYTNPSSKVYFP